MRVEPSRMGLMSYKRTVVPLCLQYFIQLNCNLTLSNSYSFTFVCNRRLRAQLGWDHLTHLYTLCACYMWYLGHNRVSLSGTNQAIGQIKNSQMLFVQDRQTKYWTTQDQNFYLPVSKLPFWCSWLQLLNTVFTAKKSPAESLKYRFHVPNPRNSNSIGLL